jgi:hypothetical protein
MKKKQSKRARKGAPDEEASALAGLVSEPRRGYQLDIRHRMGRRMKAQPSLPKLKCLRTPTS